MLQHNRMWVMLRRNRFRDNVAGFRDEPETPSRAVSARSVTSNPPFAAHRRADTVRLGSP